MFFVLVEPLKIHAARCFLKAIRVSMEFVRLDGSAAILDNVQSDPSLQLAHTQKLLPVNLVFHEEVARCFPNEQSPKRSTQPHFVASFQIWPIEFRAKSPTFVIVKHMHFPVVL